MKDTETSRLKLGFLLIGLGLGFTSPKVQVWSLKFCVWPKHGRKLDFWAHFRTSKSPNQLVLGCNLCGGKET